MSGLNAILKSQGLIKLTECTKMAYGIHLGTSNP